MKEDKSLIIYTLSAKRAEVWFDLEGTKLQNIFSVIARTYYPFNLAKQLFPSCQFFRDTVVLGLSEDSGKSPENKNMCNAYMKTLIHSLQVILS